jgi:hypothetical protein
LEPTKLRIFSVLDEDDIKALESEGIKRIYTPGGEQNMVCLKEAGIKYGPKFAFGTNEIFV